MRITSKGRLREFWDDHPQSKEPLEAWYARVKDMDVDWQSFADLRKHYPSADKVGNCVVFDILGDRFRLICRIMYGRGRCYVLKVMTHAEYDRNQWQKACGCSKPPP